MKLSKILQNFELAARADEMKGSTHPLERDCFEKQYKFWKKELRKALKEELNRNHKIIPIVIDWPSAEDINAYY